jgi:hypothetical protein
VEVPSTSETNTDGTATSAQESTKVDGQTKTGDQEAKPGETTQQPNAAAKESGIANPSESNKPTFAVVPAGHPPFLDASTKHSTCPPSGHWKGPLEGIFLQRRSST